MSGSDEQMLDDQSATPFVSEALLDDVDAGLIQAGLLAPSDGPPDVVLQRFRALHKASAAAPQAAVPDLVAPEVNSASSAVSSSANWPSGWIRWLGLGAVGGLLATAGALLVLALPPDPTPMPESSSMMPPVSYPLRDGSDLVLEDRLIEATLVTASEGKNTFVRVQTRRSMFVSIYSHGAGGWSLQAANIQVAGGVPVKLPPPEYGALLVEQADVVVLVVSPRRFEATTRDPRAHVAALGKAFEGELIVLRVPRR